MDDERLDPMAWDYIAAKLQKDRAFMGGLGLAYAVEGTVLAVLPLAGSEAMVGAVGLAGVAALVLVWLGTMIAQKLHWKAVERNMQAAAIRGLDPFRDLLERMFTAPKVDRIAEQSQKRLVVGLTVVLVLTAGMTAVLRNADVPDLLTTTASILGVIIATVGAVRCYETRQRFTAQFGALAAQQQPA